MVRSLVFHAAFYLNVSAYKTQKSLSQWGVLSLFKARAWLLA